MAHRQRRPTDVVAHFRGQPQQPDVVGHRRSILADRLGDLLLGQAELVGEPAVGVRLFDRIEVLALDVLDERGRQQPSSGMSRTTTGTFSSPARCDGTPAALAGDDLVAVLRLAGRRSAG